MDQTVLLIPFLATRRITWHLSVYLLYNSVLYAYISINFIIINIILLFLSHNKLIISFRGLFGLTRRSDLSCSDYRDCTVIGCGVNDQQYPKLYSRNLSTYPSNGDSTRVKIDEMNNRNNPHPWESRYWTDKKHRVKTVQDRE